MLSIEEEYPTLYKRMRDKAEQSIKNNNLRGIYVKLYTELLMSGNYELIANYKLHLAIDDIKKDNITIYLIPRALERGENLPDVFAIVE